MHDVRYITTGNTGWVVLRECYTKSDTRQTKYNTLAVDGDTFGDPWLIGDGGVARWGVGGLADTMSDSTGQDSKHST